ncbi:L-lactate dehydrogenase [Desulfovibrio aminophilus]|nr:L-lactate dehydrogenase [Desulfovibrio aminophilus]MCM0755008.1 L-lactate dehydrogenase [Desulfovibrio aminophilus]
MTTQDRRVKVAVVGLGKVGCAFAYAMTIRRLATDLLLLDIDRRRAEGEAMDLRHGLPLVGPMNIAVGGPEDCADADIVVITAGAAQKPGQTRLELMKTNAAAVAGIVERITAAGGRPLLLLATNPVDIVTHVALRASNLPPGQVLGSGTVLDSSRFRSLLAEHCRVDPRNVHAHVLGEHGDSEVLLWSRCNISGIPLELFCEERGMGCGAAFREATQEGVTRAAYDIIDRKGSTAYAIGLSLCRIVEAVVRDQKSVLTVSTLAEGHYGLADVCLSMPCVVGAGGVEQILDAPLDPGELEALRRSGAILRGHLDDLAR